MVATAPDLQDPEKTKVIALSIWDIHGDRAPNPGISAVAPPKNHPERKDCNPARLKAYSEATMKARKEIFVARFGERQLLLRQMATLPNYWGNGAATKLLLWGIERARKEAVAVPLFAGNMGKLLCAKHGFKELGKVKIQAPSETEIIYEVTMAWDPKDKVVIKCPRPALHAMLCAEVPKPEVPKTRGAETSRGSIAISVRLEMGQAIE